MSYSRPEQAEKQRPSSPQSPEEVKAFCHQLMDRAGMSHAFTEFLKCCRPFHADTERPVAGQFSYLSRMQQSAATWMRLSAKDRSILVAGADDDVRWRGEPVAQYQDIWNETMKMRDIGRDAYIAQAKTALQKARM